MDTLADKKQKFIEDRLQEPCSYSANYVAFLDLLGFKGLCKSELNCEEIKAIFYDIELLKWRFDNAFSSLIFSERTREQCTFTMMSDSIVVSTPSNDEGLSFMLFLCSTIQSMLLKSPHTILLRGGIAKGNFYELDNLTFGPAFIDAYMLESNVAVCPRVVISEEIISDLKQRNVISNSKSSIERYLKNYKEDSNSSQITIFLQQSNDDGYYFVDYLNPLELMALQHQPATIQTIRCHIIDGCFNQNIRYQQKFKWLCRYFNYKIEHFPLSDMSKYLI